MKFVEADCEQLGTLAEKDYQLVQMDCYSYLGPAGLRE